MSLKRSSLKEQAKPSKIRALGHARQLIANQQPEASRASLPAPGRAPRRARATPPAPLPPPPPAPARASLSAPAHGEQSEKPSALRAGGRAENFAPPFQGGELGAVADGKLRRRRFTPAEDAAILAGRQATPRVRFADIADALDRDEPTVRSRASDLGCVKGQQVRTRSHRDHARPRQTADAPAPRRCLKCRKVFQPPSKFIFRCEAHRGEG
jgi:hypothetical protein